jgi:hypothetical protein
MVNKAFSSAQRRVDEGRCIGSDINAHLYEGWGELVREGGREGG